MLNVRAAGHAVTLVKTVKEISPGEFNYERYLSSLMKIRTLPVLIATALLSTLAGSQGSEPVPAQTLTSKLKWRCVGPYIGGRVVTVTGVPGNNNLFYAGTVGGGVWKSVDNGGEWKNIND